MCVLFFFLKEFVRTKVSCFIPTSHA
uniref:Uncharacterized protein n=1 Tax=Arundo donax TaxID=35708 RepID=A0A0A9AU90_ARUDO